MDNKFDIKFFIGASFVILSIASRFLPLEPNFSPIMAVALFSGVLFSNKKIALLIPLVAMFISDLFIGLHTAMVGVYIGFGIIALLGMGIKNISFKSVLGNSILGAIIFFIVTNFAVWCAGWYGYSINGLVTCYELAIPFFRATLTSSVLYSALLFGGFYLVEKYALKARANN